MVCLFQLNLLYLIKDIFIYRYWVSVVDLELRWFIFPEVSSNWEQIQKHLQQVQVLTGYVGNLKYWANPGKNEEKNHIWISWLPVKVIWRSVILAFTKDPSIILFYSHSQDVTTQKKDRDVHVIWGLL